MSGFELLARPLPRRAVLAASGTAVLAAAAACSSGGSPSGTASTSSPASSPVPSPPGASSSASPPGAPSAAGSPTGTASSAAVTSAPPAETSAAEPVPAGPALASVADVQAAGALVVGDGADPLLLAYSGDRRRAHRDVHPSAVHRRGERHVPVPRFTLRRDHRRADQRPRPAPAGRGAGHGQRRPGVRLLTRPTTDLEAPDRATAAGNPPARARTGTAQPGPRPVTQPPPRIGWHDRSQPADQHRRPGRPRRPARTRRPADPRARGGRRAGAVRTGEPGPALRGLGGADRRRRHVRDRRRPRLPTRPGRCWT